MSDSSASLLQPIDGMPEKRAAPAEANRAISLWALPTAALAVYTIILLYIEATTSQDHVRLYFTDIGMPFKHGFFAAPTGHIGYGINTSLSSFLLGASGVLMLFAALADGKRLSEQTRLFGLQGIIFFYLSLDDRLMLHERIAAALHTKSTFVLASVTLLNILLYLRLFRPSQFSFRMIWLFTAAAVLFGIMMVYDLAMPHYMPLRLSTEDLLKTWSNFCFLQFAWEAARFRLIGQPSGEEGFRLPDQLLALVPRRFRERAGS